MKIKLLIGIYFILPFILLGQEPSPQKGELKKNEWHIFILMGQSNMAGYGELLPEDSIPLKGVFHIPTICSEEYKWLPAVHPLHNRLKSDRFGLGLPFVKEYKKKHPNVTIGLIPVAWGGASIDQLNKGTDTYNDAISKAKFAKKKGTVKAVLWHQGESDSVNKKLASAYEKKLHQLISDLRTDLGNSQLPFIAGNLAGFYGTGKDHNAPKRVDQINEVKAALRSLTEKVKNTGFVESSGCTSIDHHNVHFNRNSYIILGKRYAAKYEDIHNEKK